MDSHESNEDLIRKIIYYVVNYEVESGKKFPDSNWWTINLVDGYYIQHPREMFYDGAGMHPDFYAWVSILANRRVRLRDIQRTIYEIMRAFRLNHPRIIREDIEETRSNIESIKRFHTHQEPEWLNSLDSLDSRMLYHNLSLKLRQLEKIEEKLVSTIEKAIDKAVKGHHGPARLIGHMTGLEDYKIESGYYNPEEHFAQQLLERIPDLLSQGIGYEQFLTGIDPIGYQLFTYIQYHPELVSRIQEAFQL